MPTTRPTRRAAVGAAVACALGAAVATAPGGFAAQPETAERTALHHLRGGAFGLSAADTAHLEITDATTSAATGVRHVYLRQQHAGLDVLGAEATVNVKDGRVVHSGSHLVAGLAQKASGTARLSAVQAFAAAARGLRLSAPTAVRALAPETGVARTTVLSGGGLTARPVRAHLAYQALDSGAVRLAWVLDLDLVGGDHWYLASVDAQTGALLKRVDLVDSEQARDTAAALARPASFSSAPAASTARRAGGPAALAASYPQASDGASYRVFSLPMESPNDGDRELVTNPADARFSPYGWHDTDGAPGAESTLTQGNNVRAYGDTKTLGVLGITVNTDIPDPVVGQSDGGSTLAFDEPFDPEDPTALQNREAAITNLFYWNNTIHDVLAGYGFDEEAGNFQVTNYTGSGAGGDQVEAQAQDGSGTNNANFGTPADGRSPRMQMYLWDPTVAADPTAHPQLRDGDFDSGVITHEYGHGVSNRLTGGPSNVSCLDNDEQMGEGWSDFLGVALTMRDGDKGTDPRGLGTYVLFEDARTDGGIRPTPYSTDLRVNPTTYDKVKTAAVPHGVGYVWATMLYDLYWKMVEEHGFNPDVRGAWTTGGNNRAVQLVVEGMKMQPCSPGFVDGRDAILAADDVLAGGEDRCAIWDVFARRGLGVDADQGSSSSTTDGSEGTAVPEDCTTS